MSEKEILLEEIEDQYCLKFKLDKGQSITSKKFLESMQEALESLEDFNHAIVHGIDNTIQVVSYIEELEGGSIKIWLKDKIQSISDENIENTVNNGIVKTVLSSVLIKAKEIAIKALDDNEELSIEERKMKIINPIEEEINKNIKNIKPDEILANISFNEDDKENLLKAVGKLSNASANIEGNITFIKKHAGKEEPELDVKQTFLYGIKKSSEYTETAKEELVSESIVEEPYYCLTPTAIEGNLWKFEDGENVISCKMSDKEFFDDYVKQKNKLGGRQKMKLKLKIEKFEKSKKIVKKYTILKAEIIEEKDLFNQ